MPERYETTIRGVLGHLAGRTIVDVVQHDPDEWEKDGSCYVQLLLDDGGYVKFHIGDEGFSWGHPELWTEEPDGWF